MEAKLFCPTTFIFFHNVRILFKTILCIKFLYIIDSIIDSSTQKDCKRMQFT